MRIYFCGSAAVRELAEAYQLSNLKPKRIILFLLFASEEQGLFGLKHFVNNLKIDPEKIIAMLNLYSIGYGDSIQVGNGKSSPVLWEIARNADKQNFNLVVEVTWSGGGADAISFNEKGIPSLYFVSKYSYDYLNQQADKADKADKAETLNQKIFENIVRLVYLTSSEMAGRNYKREKIINFFIK